MHQRPASHQLARVPSLLLDLPSTYTFRPSSSIGKQLFAWTVNSAEHLRSVLDVGVDALVTNYPTTALAAIEERLAQCARRGGSGGGGNSGKGNGRSGRSRGRGKQHRGGGNGVSNDGDYL